MDTLNRIVDNLRSQKRTQKDLTDFLGIHKGSFTQWKAGKNTSYLKYLPQIAQYLDVSIDYLLGNTDIKKEPSIEEDAELRELLKQPKLRAAWELLSKMDERQLDVALAQVEALYRLRKDEEQ